MQSASKNCPGHSKQACETVSWRSKWYPTKCQTPAVLKVSCCGSRCHWFCQICSFETSTRIEYAHQSTGTACCRQIEHSKLFCIEWIVRKFLRRSTIQISFKLHGKGSLNLPTDTAARMQQIRDISSQYDARNICNMDESGLFYSTGLRTTYLTRDEERYSTQ